MVRKCVFVFGMLLGASALVLDGTASTAEACGGCRSRCCRPRCGSCYTSCYAPAPCCAPAPCYSSCGTCSTAYYAPPSCSTCSTGYYGYPTPVNAVQVPGYGAQYGYSVPAQIYPSRTIYRAKYVTMR